MRLIDVDVLLSEAEYDNNFPLIVTADTPTIDPESLRYTAHLGCLGEAEALRLGSKYAASYCSRCRGRVRCRSDYCPHCGAKMEDREE